MTSTEIADRAAHLALEKKARDILILDLHDLTSASDRFVVCSADSETQVKAVADHVLAGLAKHGVKAWHVEGLESRRWVLLDYVDVVVHVFYSETRDFYALETLWGDAPATRVDDDAREIA
ncbi:ribosome silencing factor [bacterium]|nr:ribosome silencing factor [bacterium]